MADPAPLSAASPRSGSSRSWLRVLYFVFAGVDILAVCASLFLIWTVVQVNQHWAEWLEDAAQLERDAMAVNAPGNEVFGDEARREELERRLVQSKSDFDLTVEKISERVGAEKNAARSKALGAAVDRVRDAVNDVAEEADLIFQAFRRDGLEVAGRHMALMDKKGRDATLAILALGDVVRDFQAADLRRQRTGEFVIGSFVAVMIACVVVFGHLLARETREEQRRLAQLVEIRTAELERSHTKLRMADRLASIGTLAAGLGHDMSNVLFPVRCRLDAIAAEPLDAAVREEVEEMRRSIEYLQQLSDGLRLLALDPDDSEAASATTNLTEWWPEVRPLLRTALPRHARLEGTVAPVLPLVTVAPHRLTQAVLNLVVNAGEASPPGGLVTVSAAATPEGVRIAVRDEGHGMTEEVRQRAFDPFFTTKKRGLSTGLGLALVHGVATSAGGRVQIESAPGRGTTVTIDLPAARGPGGRPAATPRATISVGDARLGTFLGSLLGASGFEVEHTAHGSAPDATLWVVDALESALPEARRFVAAGRGRRRVIAVGAVNGAWRDLGATLLPPGADIEAIRQAIRAARDGGAGAE
jgi:signal transduction histidine kinase